MQPQTIEEKDGNKQQKPQQTPQQKTINQQLLKRQTLISLNDVSETLKEAKVINIQLDQINEGVDSSYNKIQTIDQELQGQLQIIRMLVVKLENKKLDVQLHYDKVLISSQSAQKLQNALQKLSESQINQSLLKLSQSEEEIKQQQLQDQLLKDDLRMSQINDINNKDTNATSKNNFTSDNQQMLGQSDTANTQRSEIDSKIAEAHQSNSMVEDIPKIKTLCDFVDEESIELITSKAETSMQTLKSIKDETIQITDTLIKQIDLQISKIHKSKSDLDYQHSQLRSKYRRLKAIQNELVQMGKSIEKVHNQIDTITLQQQQLEQLYQAIIVIHKQSGLLREEMNQLFEIFRNQSDSYDDFYEISRESYVSFVNFAPTVQQTMQEVDQWYHQFELSRQQCLEDYDEIEKLTTWYEYFQKSYQELEIELERRRQYEMQLREKVEMFRIYLQQEIKAEQQLRIDFNDSHYRYLPANLKQNLDDPPVRYEIYPKFYDQEFTESQISINEQQQSTNRILEFLENFSQQLNQYQNVSQFNNNQENFQSFLNQQN